MSGFLQQIKVLIEQEAAFTYGLCVEISYNNQLQEWESRVRPRHKPELWAAASGLDVEKVLADTLKQVEGRASRNDTDTN